MSDPSATVASGPRPLHAATYLSLVVMFGIGVSSLARPLHQALGVALGLAFALVSTLGERALRRGQAITGFFALQAALIAAALLLPARVYDAFAFLFFMLTFQAWLIFAPPTSAHWTLLFFAISSLKVYAERGAAGWIGIAFNGVAFLGAAILGTTTQRSELARRENARLLAELRQAQHELQGLAVAKERNRLARELHDSVKQQVFAVLMQLGAARVLLGDMGHPAHQPLVEAERLAQQAGAELRMLIHELRPAELSERGLAPVLADYLAAWSRQTGIAGGLHAADTARLPPPVEYGLLRVAQEALANVARHSQARSVTVTLAAQPRAATLTIADAGRGFAADEQHQGVGLSSMRERLAGMGGRLVITSRPGAGTTVTAHWEASDD